MTGLQACDRRVNKNNQIKFLLKAVMNHVFFCYIFCLVYAVVLDCGSPPSVSAASITTPAPYTTTYLSVVTYQCSEGYHISKRRQKNITCEETVQYQTVTATWSLIVTSCTGIVSNSLVTII